MTSKLTNSLLASYVSSQKVARAYRVVPVYRYNSTMGVKAGWDELLNLRTSFAGVDTFNLSSMDPPDLSHEYTSFPFAQTSVALGHFVPECLSYNDLRISLPNLALIFAGRITRWNDPSLVQDAPCLQSADSKIIVLYRSTSSSATYAITEVLHAVDPGLFQPSYTWPYPLAGAQYLPSNDAMLFRIRISNYSIGYLPWAVRDSSFSISYASVKNLGSNINLNRSTVRGAGRYFEHNPAASFPNCTTCWPFLATSYFALPLRRIVSASENLNPSNPSSCINIADAANFLDWTYNHDSGLEEYAPISPSTRSSARRQLSKITCNGNYILSTNYAWLSRWRVLKSALLIGYAVGSGIVAVGVLLIIYNERLHSRDVRMLAAMVGESDNDPEAQLLQGLVSRGSDDLIIPLDDDDLPLVDEADAPRQVASSSSELIPISDIAIGRLIGSGSFGEVFKATHHRTTVAVKRIALTQDPTALSNLIREIRVLQLLRHPNVLHLIGFGIQAPYCYLVSEYCKHKSLDVFMKRQTGIITYRTRLDWMIDTARGMDFIHSKDVIHRDLKLSNLLLDGDMRVKIGDLGTSATGLLVHRTRVGSVDHCAPEVLDGKPYDRSCDVYSFAICLWCLFSGIPLYHDHTMFDIITRVTSGQRPTLDAIPSPRLAALIESCWNQQPAERPSFGDITLLLERMDDSDFQAFA